LNAFGGGEQVRIDCGGADRSADLTHRLPHCIEKCPAGVLHKMPAVCNLGGVRQRFRRRHGIASAAIAGDNSDLWLASEPGLRGGGLPVGQETDWPPPFEIADDRSIALVAAPRPVVDADHAWRSKR